jgi:hypothetical protein
MLKCGSSSGTDYQAPVSQIVGHTVRDVEEKVSSSYQPQWWEGLVLANTHLNDSAVADMWRRACFR